MLDKSYANTAVAVADIRSGASIAVGGFGLSGNPTELINALLDAGIGDLSIVSNNCGTDGKGLGVLLAARRISRITASYVGENKEFERQYLRGELEVELTPQGTLAEKLRAGGSGIPAFFTRTGVGTLVADGGLPQKYADDGSVLKASEAKEVRTIDFAGVRQQYVLEHSIVTDYALVHAALGDTHGNLVFNKAARQFSVPAAMAGRICIAQVEELVPAGELDPAQVHLPGVFVHRIVEVGEQHPKPIERRTTRGSQQQ